VTKDLTYQIECGPEDILYTFVYEIEPYNKGGRDEPESGGFAFVNAIMNPDGSFLPKDSWAAAGIDIEKIEADIYEWHCDREEAARDAAEEDRADAERERRLEDGHSRFW
jgi:hypothetical protein